MRDCGICLTGSVPLVSSCSPIQPIISAARESMIAIAKRFHLVVSTALVILLENYQQPQIFYSQQQLSNTIILTPWYVPRWLNHPDFAATTFTSINITRPSFSLFSPCSLPHLITFRLLTHNFLSLLRYYSTLPHVLFLERLFKESSPRKVSHESL